MKVSFWCTASLHAGHDVPHIDTVYMQPTSTVCERYMQGTFMLQCQAKNICICLLMPSRLHVQHMLVVCSCLLHLLSFTYMIACRLDPFNRRK